MSDHDAVDFLYKHREFTRTAAWETVRALKANGFIIARLDTVYTRAQAEAMVADERERIAYEIVELAEHDAEERNWKDGAKLCRRIAAAIRAQGEADEAAAHTQETSDG